MYNMLKKTWRILESAEPEVNLYVFSNVNSNAVSNANV